MEQDTTRSRLLDAAEHLFAERGYRSATIQEIGRRAGVAPALLYHYFHDKRALHAAVIERHVSALVEYGGARLDADDDAADPAARIRALLEVQGRILLGRPGAARVIGRELAEQGDGMMRMVRERLQPLFRRLVATIEEGQRSGAFRTEVEPEFAALSTISQIAWFAVASPVVEQLLERGGRALTEADRARFAAHAADFAIASLTASGTGP